MKENKKVLSIAIIVLFVGSSVSPIISGNISYLQNSTHRYTNPDNYTVNLTVIDDDRSTDNINKSITIITPIELTDVTNLSYQWNFVSLPFNQSVDKTDFVIRYNGSDYFWYEAVSSGIIVDFIYGWDRITQKYEMADTLSPGFGYWIYAYHDCEVLAKGVSNFVTDNFITDLFTNWNIIGLPHNKSLHRYSIIIRYNGTDYSWYDATTGNNEEGNPLIVGFIYGWDTDNQYYILSDVFTPEYGYWMYAYYNCSLYMEIYIPPTNNVPTQSNHKIWNATTKVEKSLNATDVDLYPTSFNITINDINGDNMNITILTNESGTWTVVNQTTGPGLSNGTYNFTNTSWISDYYTTYYISFNLTDGTDWDNDTYYFTTKSGYIEQSPLPRSEWDGAYNDNKFISNFAWINISKTYNTSAYKGRRMVDSIPFSRYASEVFSISSVNPLNLYFEFHNTTNVSYLRYYYDEPSGLDYCPAKYKIYADGTLIHTGNYTAQVNGQWVKIDFPDRDVMNLTWSIIGVRGGNPTQVIINEIELFSAEPRRYIEQENINYSAEIAQWWNGLDWAYSLHIDDITNANNIPLAWYQRQPLTLEMMSTGSLTCPDTWVDDYHAEYASHGDWQGTGGDTWGYGPWYTHMVNSRNDVEDATTKTSLWSTKCISFAHPSSRATAHGQQAIWDAGFRVAGQVSPVNPILSYHIWELRDPRNMSIYNYSYPRINYDYLFFKSDGGNPIVGSGWTTSKAIIFREENQICDFVVHIGDTLKASYVTFIEADTTGWQTTNGEVVSYEWYKDWTNVTFNDTASSTYKKVFDINIYNSDDRIWKVPMTFKFNLTSFNWNGSISVKWSNNGTIYNNSLSNISGFSAGSGQHTNQTMREGYSWDSINNILYISTKLGDQSSPKSIYIYSEAAPTQSGEVSANSSTCISVTKV